VFAHDAELYEVEEREYKYPNQVNEVPVKTNLFDHSVVTSALVGTQQHVVEQNEVKYNSREHVKTVETGDEEEEIRKQLVAVLVAVHVGTLNYISTLSQQRHGLGVLVHGTRLAGLDQFPIWICFERGKNIRLIELFIVVAGVSGFAMHHLREGQHMTVGIGNL
jgi:hypothetical protein